MGGGGRSTNRLIMGLCCRNSGRGTSHRKLCGGLHGLLN